MSQSERGDGHSQQCNSCGMDVSGTNAARFACPECGDMIFRCATCRKQSNDYECPNCGFRGP
ncbi:RNA-binding protein [Halobacteriales archaeon QS_3_64_16]|nr:MAG: RNA-binding protein [Halobacteriales archaeon QS_3_64_16]